MSSDNSSASTASSEEDLTHQLDVAYLDGTWRKFFSQVLNMGVGCMEFWFHFGNRCQGMADRMESGSGGAIGLVGERDCTRLW